MSEPIELVRLASQRVLVVPKTVPRSGLGEFFTAQVTDLPDGVGPYETLSREYPRLEAWRTQQFTPQERLRTEVLLAGRSRVSPQRSTRASRVGQNHTRALQRGGAHPHRG